MEPMARVLDRVLRQTGLETELKGWQAVHDWDDIVGPRLARHTKAVGFRDGTLRIEVEGSAWMHEMGFLRRDLIRSLNERLGDALVRDLRFQVARGGIRR
jgi:predicted nucleic acid-binding Zn ribbon protein